MGVMLSLCSGAGLAVAATVTTRSSTIFNATWQSPSTMQVVIDDVHHIKLKPHVQVVDG